MTEEIKGTIVVDNGTGMIKAGFAGEDQPRSRVPSIVGSEPSIAKVTEKTDRKKLHLGAEALNRNDLVITRPMTNGIVADWEAMEWLWDYTFVEQLNVNIEDYFVLLTEPPMNPTSNREKMAEIMFEAFGVPGLHVGMQALLALFSEGLTTGLVLDIGDGVTHCVPVFDGYAVSTAVMRQNLAGRDLTDYLVQLLRERGLFYESSAEHEIVRDIKEKLCYIPIDYAVEAKKYVSDRAAYEKAYVLPDGQVITITDQLYRCPEALFHPQLIGKDLKSLPDLLVAAVMKSPIDTRKRVLENVVLSGGSTCFTGFPERLNRDLQTALVSANMRNISHHIQVPDERRHCVWRGGSVLASLPTFESILVSLEEYEEVGPAIMSQKAMESCAI